MAIAKMRLINIISPKSNLEEVLLKFSELDNFHPESAAKMIEKVSSLESMNEDSPYTELLQEYDSVASLLGVETEKMNSLNSTIDIKEAESFIYHVKNRTLLIDNVNKELEALVQENEDALKILDHIMTSDFSFDDLFSCEYVKVRIGRMPINSAKQVERRDNHMFAFISFTEDRQYSWCAYLTTLEHEAEVDNIFSSLSFERIRVPSFIHGTPDNAREVLVEEIENDKKHLNHVQMRKNEYISHINEQFGKYYATLKHLDETYSIRKYAIGLGDQFEISGFVEEKDVGDIQKAFESIEGVIVENFPSDFDQRLTPPTKLKNNWFTKPFEMFVEMYGLPEYGQFDPTPFVAITYTLLFGIMFGDLGQGLILILVGLIASKKFKMKLGDIGVRIGLSSSLFGLLYGSFFGNEEILTPFFTEILHLHEKPIEVLDANFTMPLLISTIVLGASLILISISINTFMNFKNKRLGEALFSQNGVAGLVFYGGLLAGVGLQMGLGIPMFNPLYTFLVICLPLFLIFTKEPLSHKLVHKPMFPDGFGGFFVESFFELLEVCLTFVANTMSFLRIGGFVLSHAGMMLVVYVLAEMVGPTFAPIVLVFGNIFVMCLEGMIVGIQVLRLEFYEMFSRYYDGGGIEFRTVKIEE